MHHLRLTGAAALLVAASAFASSHREAPLISNDPAADATDLYAWRRGAAASATVVLVANYYPLAVPAAGPNYYGFDDNVLYEIKIDNTGDARPDVVYQFRFKTTVNKDPLGRDSFLAAFAPVTFSNGRYVNLLREQRVTVTRQVIPASGAPTTTTIVSGGPVAPWPIGRVTTANYDSLAANAIISAGTRQIFCGPRDDPFFVNLGKTFDFLDYPPAAGSDDLKGMNVLSLVLEVPATDLTPGGAAVADCAPSIANCANAQVVHLWTTASRPRVSVKRNNGSADGHGGWVQVSRLGNPLINEVIVPMRFKDLFNASQPQDDAQFTSTVLDPELPYLLAQKTFIPKVPPAPRLDLAKALATPAEMLHLNLSVPPSTTENRLGALGGDPAGFPNGRRLADDVTDIALQVVGGAVYQALGAQDANDVGADGGATDYATPASALGDNVNCNDKAFLGQGAACDGSPPSAFPYLASPTMGNP